MTYLILNISVSYTMISPIDIMKTASHKTSKALWAVVLVTIFFMSILYIISKIDNEKNSIKCKAGKAVCFLVYAGILLTISCNFFASMF